MTFEGRQIIRHGERKDNGTKDPKPIGETARVPAPGVPLSRTRQWNPFVHVVLPDLSQGLWLAVDEVIHHNDISSVSFLCRPGGNIAGGDPDPRDARIIKHDAEEGLASINR